MTNGRRSVASTLNDALSRHGMVEEYSTAVKFTPLAQKGKYCRESTSFLYLIRRSNHRTCGNIKKENIQRENSYSIQMLYMVSKKLPWVDGVRCELTHSPVHTSVGVTSSSLGKIFCMQVQGFLSQRGNYEISFTDEYVECLTRIVDK